MFALWICINLSSSCVHFAHLWFYKSLTVHVYLPGQRALSDSHRWDWLELLNLFMFYAKGCSILCLLGIWTIPTAFRGGMKWIDLIKQLDDVWTNQNGRRWGSHVHWQGLNWYILKHCAVFWSFCSAPAVFEHLDTNTLFHFVLCSCTSWLICTGTFAHTTLTQFDATGHLWAMALHLVLIFAEKKYEGKYCTNS